MPTATPIVEPTWYIGPARTFRVEPELRDPSSGQAFGHVTVCKTTLGGPRVEVIGSVETGNAVVMNPLPGSFVLQHDVSLDDACVWALATAGGYVIGPPDPEPEPEPEPDEAVLDEAVLDEVPVPDEAPGELAA